MRAKTAARSRIRCDVPESYIRAIRVRAAQEAVYPRDVLIRALDRYLAGDGKSLATTESCRATAPTTPAR